MYGWVYVNRFDESCSPRIKHVCTKRRRINSVAKFWRQNFRSWKNRTIFIKKTADCACVDEPEYRYMLQNSKVNCYKCHFVSNDQKTYFAWLQIICNPRFLTSAEYVQSKGSVIPCCFHMVHTCIVGTLAGNLTKIESVQIWPVRDNDRSVYKCRYC